MEHLEVGVPLRNMGSDHFALPRPCWCVHGVLLHRSQITVGRLRWPMNASDGEQRRSGDRDGPPGLRVTMPLVIPIAESSSRRGVGSATGPAATASTIRCPPSAPNAPKRTAGAPRRNDRIFLKRRVLTGRLLVQSRTAGPRDCQCTSCSPHIAAGMKQPWARSVGHDLCCSATSRPRAPGAGSR